MAETNSLLNCRTGNCTGGSNPPFSARDTKSVSLLRRKGAILAPGRREEGVLFSLWHTFCDADGTGGADETAEMATDAFGTEDLWFAFFIKSYRLMAAVGA